jgi:hypothetical protein
MQFKSSSALMWYTVRCTLLMLPGLHTTLIIADVPLHTVLYTGVCTHIHRGVHPDQVEDKQSVNSECLCTVLTVTRKDGADVGKCK